jgi:hypothetical protein
LKIVFHKHTIHSVVEFDCLANVGHCLLVLQQVLFTIFTHMIVKKKKKKKKKRRKEGSNWWCTSE